MKNKLSHKKIITIIVLLLVVSIIGVNSIIANANVSTEPKLNLSLNFSQGSAGIGEEVTVTGTIKPQPFDVIDKPQELVLLLDVSNSMNKNEKCTLERVDKYCTNHGSSECKECGEIKVKSNNGLWWYCVTHKQYIEKWHMFSDEPKKCKDGDHHWENDYCIEHGISGEHESDFRKLDKLKESASNFIEEMKSVPNLKISIISYDKQANILTHKGENKFIDASKVNDLNKIIENLKVGNNDGNNIGEALRKAAYVLNGEGTGQNPQAEKNIVLMTDGYPTFYTKVDKKNDSYYTDITKEEGGVIYASGNGNEDTGDLKDLGYAKKIGETLKGKNYNIYTIGYILYGIDKDRINSLHQSMSGIVGNRFTDTGILKNKFSGVANAIKNRIAGSKLKSYTISDIQYDTSLGNFSENLKSSLSDSNNIVKINDITYTKLKNSNTYKADDVTFEFTITGKEAGSYTLFKGTKIEYKFNGQAKSSWVDGRNLNIIGNGISKDIPITIQVSDSGGNISDKYNTKDQGESRVTYNKQVLNKLTGNEFRLFGSAKAEIKLDTTKVTVDELQYQFIKSQNQSYSKSEDIDNIEVDDTKWQDIDLTMDTINEDVDIENQGSLTQREYNVSNLPALSNNAIWSDRTKVFGTPLDGIYTKSTAIAQTPQQYGEWIKYTDSNNKETERWRTKTIFMKNMRIEDKGGISYKEASKYWGYYSPEQSGWYNFALKSDDGAAGWLTVGGVQTEFSNQFKPQGSTRHHKGTVIYLEKGKYYPLYLEYFNWGGGAEFRMEYRYLDRGINNKPVIGDFDKSSKWTDISEKSLYPSKSTEPGESATNIFAGSKGVSFPEEPGKYYIAYRCVAEDKVLKNGLYGPFNIDEKISVERSVSKEEIQVNEEVFLTYTVKSMDIDVKDIYKGASSNPQPEIYINNVKINDVIGAGLTITNPSSKIALLSQNIDEQSKENKIQLQLINPIKFKLSSDKTKYISDDINIVLKCKSSTPGEYNLDAINCFYNYNDVIFKVNEKSPIHFQGKSKEDLVISVLGGSKILNHGVYLGHKEKLLEESTNSSAVRIVSTIDLNLGVIVDVKHNDTNVRISSSMGTIDMSKLKIYEVNTDNSLKPAECKTTIKNDIITFVNGADKKYMIIYEFVPKGTLNNTILMNAEIVGYYSSKELRLRIGQDGIPDLF